MRWTVLAVTVALLAAGWCLLGGGQPLPALVEVAAAAGAEPMAVPEARAAAIERVVIDQPIDDIKERIAGAATVKDAIRALGWQPGVGLDATQRMRLARELFSSLDQAGRKLADHRASLPAEDNASVRLDGLRLEERWRRADSVWRAFCAGDYVPFDDGRTLPLRHRFDWVALTTDDFRVTFVYPLDVVMRRLWAAIEIEASNVRQEWARDHPEGGRAKIRYPPASLFSEKSATGGAVDGKRVTGR